jgi:hypothetical protein
MPPGPIKGVPDPGSIPVVAAVAVPATRKNPKDRRNKEMASFFIFIFSNHFKV